MGLPPELLGPGAAAAAAALGGLPPHLAGLLPAGYLPPPRMHGMPSGQQPGTSPGGQPRLPQPGSVRSGPPQSHNQPGGSGVVHGGRLSRGGPTDSDDDRGRDEDMVRQSPHQIPRGPSPEPKVEDSECHRSESAM